MKKYAPAIVALLMICATVIATQVLQDSNFATALPARGTFMCIDSSTGYTLVTGTNFTVVSNFTTKADTGMGANTHSNLTIGSKVAYYDYAWGIGHSGAGGGEEYEGGIFTNGVRVSAIEQHRKTSGNDLGYFGSSGTLYTDADVVVTLRVIAVDGSASSIGIEHCQLNCWERK